MNTLQQYSILFLLLLGAQHLSAQCPPPQGEATQSFCGAALRGQINEPPANLIDLVVIGENLQWYSDAAGTQPIPNTTLLTAGQTYYVSQTTTGSQGCESSLLAVTATEKYCNCVPNGGFERDPTTATASGYTFKYYDFNVGFPSGMQQCQTDLNSLNLQPKTNLDPVNGPYNPTNYLDNFAYIVTPGPDALMSGNTTTQIRVEPNTPYNQRALGLNDHRTGGSLSLMYKEIIAGQSFSFDYSFAADYLPGSFPSSEPFFRVQVLDQNNNLVSERCIAFSTDNCHFARYGTNTNGYSYSTRWTCMELDTQSIVGQPATVVFAVSDFEAIASRAGYVYLDNLGNATCSNSVFGKVALDAPQGTAGSSNCSLLEPVNQDVCLPPVTVQEGPFPLEICGTYDAGRGARLSSILLTLSQNGQVVGTRNTGTMPGPGQYCFSVQPNDISVPPYGTFTYTVETNFSCTSTSFGDTAMDTGIPIKICPEAGCPSDELLCTPPGSTPTFDLRQKDGEIKGTMPPGDVLVSYYEDEQDARQGQNKINNITNYTRALGTYTLYARLNYDYPAIGIPPEIDCYDLVSFELTFTQAPDLPVSIPALALCDSEGNGIREFDLNDVEGDITINELNPGDYTVSYYESIQDRQNDNPIATADLTAYENTTSPQPIYVSLEGSNGCISTMDFDLVVNPIPTYNPPATLSACDDAILDGTAPFTLSTATSQITGNDPDLTVSYYEQQADAESGANNALPDPYTNTTPYNQTIYVRIVSSSTGCSTTASLDLVVKQAPAAITPAVYTVCDPDNDGTADFDLPTLDSEITAGATGVSVSYHATLANAENNVLPLPNIFTNTVNTAQTIYARVSSPGVDCYNVVEVALKVTDSPQPVLPANLSPLSACDTDGNGSEVFDLTAMRGDILANEADRSDFDLSYYANQNDLTNDNPISVPAAYTSTASPQTIYVVVEGSNACTKGTSFEITVNPLPVIYPPSALELCDVNNPGDEKEAFDLEQATTEITGGDPSISVTYYEKQTNADNGNSPLPSPYTNTVNNQTIYIQAKSLDTGCLVSQGYTLTLTVNPLPSPEIPTTPIAVCDVDNDGFVEVDLDELSPAIINGELDTEITYHLTKANAESGANAIDTGKPFGMSSANNQTLYVRATNTVTGCYVTGKIELEGTPSPEITKLEDLVKCDDSTPDGFARFDLTQNTPLAIGNQDATAVTVSYYTDQQDAQNGTGAIALPSQYTNITNPQTIYVRIANTGTGCYDTFDYQDDNSFTLTVEPLPAIVEPSPLQVCDNDYVTTPVSQTVFDLTTKETEMSGGTNVAGYGFTYYANQSDFNNGQAIADPTAYQNTENPQAIYVEVADSKTDGSCISTTTLTIEVLPLPSPSETDPDVLRIEECDDDNDGITAEPFDLTQSGQLIASGENVDLSYYTTQRAAENGDTNAPEYITDPTAYTNDPALNTTGANGEQVQIIYVRVDSGVNGNFCYVIVEMEIQVVPAPVLNPNGIPFGYTLCEDGNTGSVAINPTDITENMYDPTNGSPNELIPLLDEDRATNANQSIDLADYIVSYYAFKGDADTGTSPIAQGYVASDGDILYIRVETRSSGCYNTGAIGEVVITVETRPGIADIYIDETFCSDGPGGESVTVDLTGYDATVNPGAPADTQVVYYADMDAYNNGTSIEGPTAYTTIENPQTIIAEVVNTNTLCESPNVVEITIDVEPVPMADISSYDGMVICSDSDPNTPVIGGGYGPQLIDTGLPDDGTYTFTWTLDGNTLPENGPTIEVTGPGTYSVTVANVAGNECETTSSATFEGHNPPEFTVSPLSVAFEGDHSLVIQNITGNGDYEFRLDNGPWMDLAENESLTLDGIAAGDHLVYGRDKGGCGATAHPISFIDFPKFFTPNEDGYNDSWNIIGLGDQPAAKIYIFDRYGKLLKQLAPGGEGWDGTFNGKAMPSNDYWFRVEYTKTYIDADGLPKASPGVFKNHFTLKR